MKNIKTPIIVLAVVAVILLLFAKNMQSNNESRRDSYVGLMEAPTSETSEASKIPDNPERESNKTEEESESPEEASSNTTSIDFDLPISPDNTPEQILHRKSYIVSYNKLTKLPNWVAWHLTPAHTDGYVERPGNAWHEDDDVPYPRATLADYKGSGWTRGHMCPAGDNKWDSDAMYESFLFTNCCPQNANLNSGTWNQIEMSTRRWAERWGDLYIVCGPILFKQEHETIGVNKVVVPEAFFKVIVCLNSKHPKGIGFICRNTDGNRKKDLYVNSVKQVERVTGIKFFPNLPAELSEAVKNDANLNDWE